MAGALKIEMSPRRAMAANQTSMTGPKMEPTDWVPRRCIQNKPTNMTSERMMMVRGEKAMAPIFKPSMALNTEMAGVISPSP